MSTIEAVRSLGLNARAADALLTRVSYRRILDAGERETVFRGRYEAYLHEGAIGPRADGRFTDPVDDQANAFLFGIYVDGAIAGSVRLNVTLPHDDALPTAAVFPEYFKPRIDAGCVIVDITRFVSDRTVSRHLSVLPYLTLRLAWLAMEHFDGDYIMLAVRPEHRAFYRRFWGATEIGEARPYPNLVKPVGLLSIDYLERKAAVEARHPFLLSTEAERAGLFTPSCAPDEIHCMPAGAWQFDRVRAERTLGR